MTARQLERTLTDLEREENAWEELDLDMQETTDELGRTAREIYYDELVPVGGSMWTREELNQEAYGTYQMTEED